MREPIIPLSGDAAEFRSIQRSLPTSLVTTLMLATVVYGASLTLTLPFNLWDGLFESGPVGMTGVVGSVLFSTLLVLTMMRWCLVHPTAFLGFCAQMGTQSRPAETEPFVSILVPACNEAETMEAAIRSLLALDYPSFEIIVIDDGSSDETLAISRRFQGLHRHCSVKVLAKPNGGKWSALNHGFSNAVGELILCVDADSRLAPQTLRVAVARMQQDPGIVGVAGQVTIRNRNRFLTRLQSLEYVLGNGGMRMAMSQVGMVTIVPGAIGLYRRTILERIAALPCNLKPGGGPHGDIFHGKHDVAETETEWAKSSELRRAANAKLDAELELKAGRVFGPFSGETFAEDFQLSLSALALGGKIVYEPRAVAFTKCPAQMDSLISQRYRWMRGTWQVLNIYLRDLRTHVKKENPRLDWLVAGCYTVDIFLIPIVNFGFWTWLAFAAALGVELGGILLWLAAIALLNLMTATVYLLAQDDDLALAPLSFLMDLYLSLVVNSAWVIAAVDEARGARMRWH